MIKINVEIMQRKNKIITVRLILFLNNFWEHMNRKNHDIAVSYDFYKCLISQITKVSSDNERVFFSFFLIFSTFCCLIFLSSSFFFFFFFSDFLSRSLSYTSELLKIYRWWIEFKHHSCDSCHHVKNIISHL